jgi:hypothetical protein
MPRGDSSFSKKVKGATARLLAVFRAPSGSGFQPAVKYAVVPKGSEPREAAPHDTAALRRALTETAF